MNPRRDDLTIYFPAGWQPREADRWLRNRFRDWLLWWPDQNVALVLRPQPLYATAIKFKRR